MVFHSGFRFLTVSTLACVLVFPSILLQSLSARALQATAIAPDHSRSNPSGGQTSLASMENDIRAGKYLAVEPALRTYVQSHPSSWRARYDLGYVLFSVRAGTEPLADRIKESITELSKSLQLNLNDADAHKILGLDLTMIQRDDLAEAEFEEAVRLDPRSAEMHYFLARHYMGQSRYPLAKSELETAIRLDPAYMKAYENLAITFDRMGNAGEALRLYLNAVALDKQQAEGWERPYLDLARFYDEQNNPDAALTYIRKALARNPKSDESFFELAKIEREKADWHAALDALQKAIVINPYQAEYYYLLGRTYRQLGRIDESKRAFENYLKYKDVAAPVS